MHGDTVSMGEAARAAAGLESASVATSHAVLETLAAGAASAFSSTGARTETGNRRCDRYGEASQQAAQLASWEDEGGTTSS